MDLVTRQELDTLMTATGEPAVSLYAPMHRAGAQTQQNPIRFKNLIRQAEGTLGEGGMSPPEVRRFLAPALELVDDYHFWQHQSDGLAMFVADGFSRTFRVPLAFDEELTVADRFYLKPLLPLLTGDGHFYILALAQHGVRLYSGARHSVSEMDLGDVPRSLEEALGHELTENHLSHHTGGGGGILHGQSAGEVDTKEEIRRFFHRLDTGVTERLKDRQAPLVLAGVEYLLPIYREANNYPHLAPGGIPGNPMDLSHEELHRKAWEVVEPLFLEAQERAAAAYRAKAGTGQASAVLEEIVPAAFDGRVETLWVALGTQSRGTFDPDTRRVTLAEGSSNGGAMDLLDSAAIQTLLHGGTVYAVASEQVPGGVPAAAVFRY